MKYLLLKCLLQHLDTDSSFTNVLVDFYDKQHELYIGFDNESITVLDGDDLPRERDVVTVNIICDLLQATRLVSGVDLVFHVTEYYVSIAVNNPFVSHIIGRLALFKQESHVPASLSKLCILTIRQHLPRKTDENFARLGLRPGHLCLVKHEKLAEVMQEMM